jgi:hypothetical protein
VGIVSSTMVTMMARRQRVLALTLNTSSTESSDPYFFILPRPTVV